MLWRSVGRRYYTFALSFVFFFFFLMIRRPPRSTLSLHDALPISGPRPCAGVSRASARAGLPGGTSRLRSEEHTSELQSLTNLVCRLLLEKKKKKEATKIPL